MPSSMQPYPDLDLEADLPLIDLSRFAQTPHDAHHHDELIANVRHACEEWGFFRVVNHGIPQTLLQDVEIAVQQLCAMPQDVKQKAIGDPSRPGQKIFCFTEQPHSDSVLQMSRKIWPEDGNPFFCKTIGTYALLMEDLAQTITKIILASLDLDVENHYQSDFQNCTSMLCINHFTSDGKSVDDEAFVAHTDIGVLTILYQDNKGGLQIRSKESTWLNVKPLSHSFVINIADCFKAWSNGRYRSVEHRVVYNGWGDRISMGYFLHFPSEKEIRAPPELVDEQHPRRYRPFTFSHLMHDFLESLHSKEQEKISLIDSGVYRNKSV